MQMQNEKIENILNLALEMPEEERRRTMDLNVGYEKEDRSWTVIVRYSDSLLPYTSELVRVNELTGGYAIVQLPESLIRSFAQLPEVEYMEKPRQLYSSLDRSISLSCVTPINEGGLTGMGTLVAVIDSGVDYRHPDFLNGDGTTRILRIWDQSVPGRPPEGFLYGTEYTEEEINQALQGGADVPSRDRSGHGTAVLGIAAGNGRASGGRYRGMAPDSQILVVKLRQPGESGFPRTPELMTALDYAVRTARMMGKPLAINLSFGNTYGSHEGNSLVETFIDTLADQWKVSIAVGTGNEADTGGHTSGRLEKGDVRMIPLAIGENEPAMNVQLWKSYADEFDVLLITPWGKVIGPFRRQEQPQEFEFENTRVLVYYGLPSPYSSAQEIYFEFISNHADTGVDSGIWNFRFVPRRIVTGRYDLWLPNSQVRNRDTRFIYPTPDTTLTIPSAASRVIAVGAYDGENDSYAPFSGRGYTTYTNRVRPDLVAPGVDIMTTAVGGGYARQSGTSFATPFVTGAAALLMEWGIEQGNDDYLYGEKLKAYLIRGARALPGIHNYPDPRVGYGALCVEDGLP